MKATESYVGQTVTEIEGKIANAGDRTVQHADVYCVFYNAYGEVILRERVPIVVGGAEARRDASVPPALRRHSRRLEQSDAAIGDRPHRVCLMARILVVEDDTSPVGNSQTNSGTRRARSGHRARCIRSAGALARDVPVVVMDLRIPGAGRRAAVDPGDRRPRRGSSCCPAGKWIPRCRWTSFSRNHAHPEAAREHR